MSTLVNAAPRERNVVLVTLDGVRWQEFLNGAFPGLHASVDRGAFIYDGEISNPDAISLPAYHSILAGETTSCHTNGCGRGAKETFAERLVRELGLPKSRVATIASWDSIALAAESVPGRTFVNAGIVPLEDGSDDAALAELNRRQVAEAPWWPSARADLHTYLQGLRYLKTHRPRFLYLSLNDSDEHAHHGDYESYLATLRRFDAWLVENAALAAEIKARYLAEDGIDP
jgi:hypothetical protein